MVAMETTTHTWETKRDGKFFSRALPTRHRRSPASEPGESGTSREWPQIPADGFQEEAACHVTA